MSQSNAERDLAMVEMYACGDTLVAIGERFQLSRERVRQILSKKGAINSEAARVVRSELRANELSESVVKFLQDFGNALEELAASGAPRAEVESRFSLLFPNLSTAVVREGLSRAGILFDVDVKEFAFSESVIESAVWFVLARELSIEAQPIRL